MAVMGSPMGVKACLGHLPPKARWRPFQSSQGAGLPQSLACVGLWLLSPTALPNAPVCPTTPVVLDEGQRCGLALAPCVQTPFPNA